MKKLISILLVLGMLVSILAACSTATPESSSSESASQSSQSSEQQSTASSGGTAEPVKLTFWIQRPALQEDGPDGKSRDAMYYAVAKEFMAKNPDVVIDTVPIGSDPTELMTKYGMAASTNTFPDMFMNTSGGLRDYAASGVVANLTDYFNASPVLKELLSTGLFYNQYQAGDGKNIYAMPTQAEAQGWYYNKALFDKYNLQIPTTFEEFKNACIVFSENGVTPISYGGVVDVWACWGFYTFLDRYGWQDEVPKFLSKELKFTDAQSPIKAYQKIDELRQAGAFASNVNTTGYDQMLETFLGGNAAMLTGGTWMTEDMQNSAIADDIVFSWGPSFSDGVGDKPMGIKVYSWGVFVGAPAVADKAKMDAIIRFFEFIAQPETSQFMYDNYGWLAAVPIEDTSKASKLAAQMFERFQDDIIPCAETPTPFGISFATPFCNTISGVVSGYATPEEAVQQLQDWQNNG